MDNLQRAVMDLKQKTPGDLRIMFNKHYSIASADRIVDYIVEELRKKGVL